MIQNRMLAVRRGLFTLPFLLALAGTVPRTVAVEHTLGASLVSWAGIGPRLVNDGYLGGLDECNCDTDQDGVACPGGGTCGNSTYHGCPVVNNGGKNYCVGSGNASYCGKGSCPSIQYGTCTGRCINSP
jgi:hypothetical protein